jgi:PAS domain S-box-containing protein
LRSGTRYHLGLILPNDLGREAIQRYLRRLHLEQTAPADSAARPSENISARIERVRIATDRLNHMQQFIRRSFERMPDGIIVTDELGVIRFANGHIEEWFREPMPSLAGLPLVRLLEGHDPRETPPWHETVSDTLTLQQSRTVDLRIRDKDFLIHFAPFSLPDSDQQGIIANISDISELREQQRQHREAIDFISHDVRSPLVSQLALIEQLKRDPSHIEQSQLEQLGRLARRSYHLAEEFVQLARAEQLTETRFYECEFLAIVENARDSVSEQAVEKQIQLQLQGTEDLWLKGNAELLERAVINLLTNAVQYSPDGSTVSIQVFRAGHQACLTIADEGTGIDSEELPHLFDRYRRQKSTELAGIHGTGLGLSFVKTVVEKHRGEISVSSKLGEGSSFTLKLPIADPMA